jgi:hypothetical protein
MSLITETGSGSASAESLISVTDADTYHSNIGNTAWAALTTPQKEQNLRKATIYMGGAYRDRWAGTRTTVTQALDWPRYMVPIRDTPTAFGSAIAYYPSTSVPTLVGYACAELAYRSSVTDLAPDLSRGIRSEQVGDIKTEYDTNSAQYTRYRQIDLMLKPFLKAGGGSSIVPLTR